MIESPSQPVAFVVGEAEAGRRVDSALAALAGISRAQARRWIDEGRVQLNARPCRPAQRVDLGDALAASPPEPLPSPLTPEPIPLPIVHEDDDVVVVDKPAGLVMHPGPGHAGGTLVNALLHHCELAGVGGVLRPGIVHRLDRGTSGVLVVAKNDAAHRSLAEQFRTHSVERVYWALVRGLQGAESGSVERAIGRHPRDRKRMSVRTESGREARTRWRVLARFPRSRRSWLEVRPETGRTHQIRVHLASAGLPIVGDPVYGRASRRGADAGRSPRERDLARPALHAAVLGFDHPRSGERLRFEAPLPEDLESLIGELHRWERAP